MMMIEGKSIEEVWEFCNLLEKIVPLIIDKFHHSSVGLILASVNDTVFAKLCFN